VNTTMRDAFLDELYSLARKDKRVILLSNDFGAPSLDKFRENCATQFIHTGIAEQNMVNVAVGLAMAGKIAYIYSLAPFVPLRCYEQIRVHLGFKNLNIACVVVGAGYSYDLSGPTHQALEDIAVMNSVPNMTILTPADSFMAASLARMTYETPGPKYLRFDREALPSIYTKKKNSFSAGLSELKKGRDLIIISTGIMVHHALKVSGELARYSIDAGVVDLYRAKPLNENGLMKIISGVKHLVTLEENFLNSGIGSIVSGFLSDRSVNTKLKRFGTPDRFTFQGGSREEIQRRYGLDEAGVTRKILAWLKKQP
jgi:transketolase